MSRTGKRSNTKGVKHHREAYRKWRVASGMRDHDAERKEKLLARSKAGRSK